MQAKINLFIAHKKKNTKFSYSATTVLRTVVSAKKRFNTRYSNGAVESCNIKTPLYD